MKFNRRLFNWSVWISLVLTYVLPYQIDGSAIKCGFPIRFWKIRINTIPNSSLLNSSSLDLLLLTINILIIYLIISFVYKLYIKIKSKNDKKK